MEKIDQHQPSRTKKERNRKWMNRCFAALFVILIGCTGYFAHSLYGVFQGFKQMDRSKFRDTDVEIAKNPFAILLIGEDGRDPSSQNWRPDTLMVATVNPKTKSIKLLSIPRDTYTEIANTNGFKTKINAAAHYGYVNGIDPVQNIRETVENLLQIPIDYYVKTNFQGFTNAVDLLGGVDVNVGYNFKGTMIGGRDACFYKGPMHLRGDEALAYVRMRKKDPLGDHGRNKRQQEVLSNLVDKAISINGIAQFGQLTKTIGSNVSFNIKLGQIPMLTRIYKESKHNLESIKITTTPTRKQGICYELLPEEEQKRVCNTLQQHLEFTPFKQYAFMQK